MCILSESVDAIDVDDKWLRNVLVDLIFLVAGAGCFIFSFSRFLGYACIVPLLLGCFLICFGTFDFLCLAFDFKLFKK
jgi:hypothetical protein